MPIPFGRKRIERALYGALARSNRQRQGRARPRFTVGEKGLHHGVLSFDGPSQHENLACVSRHQRKPAFCRAHIGQRTQHGAKAPDFDSQPRAKRFVSTLQSEGARD